MIRATMAVAALESGHLELGDYAREARLARAVALIVDTIIFSVIWSIANAVFGVSQVTWGSAVPTNGFAYYGTTMAIPWFWSVVIYTIYFTAFEAVFGATPGKFVSGLRVVSIDARPLSGRRVLLRNLLRLVDALPLLYLIGGFSVLATRRSQRLGDVAAGTTVVFRRRVLEPGATRHAGRVATRLFVAALVAVVVFAALFEYFGRPALVIQDLYNTHRLMNPEMTTYSLGQPAWAPGSVTYPIKATTPTARCTGSIQLNWDGISGWQVGSGQLDCLPS
jgi:uncharacterized RDD family membrane protein YckC